MQIVARPHDLLNAAQIPPLTLRPQPRPYDASRAVGIPGNMGENDASHELFCEAVEVVRSSYSIHARIADVDITGFRRNRETGVLGWSRSNFAQGDEVERQAVRGLGDVLAHIVCGEYPHNLVKFSAPLRAFISSMRSLDIEDFMLKDVVENSWYKTRPGQQGKFC